LRGSDAVVRFDSGEEWDRNEATPRFKSLKGQVRQAVENLSDTLKDTFGALRFSSEVSRPDRGRGTVAPSEQEEGSEVDDSNSGSRQSESAVEEEEEEEEEDDDDDDGGEGREGELSSDAEETSIQGSRGGRRRSSVDRGSSRAGRSERRGSKLRRRRSSQG
jgi:hypothetical protein